jgi:hypothetical protein
VPQPFWVCCGLVVARVVVRLERTPDPRAGPAGEGRAASPALPARLVSEARPAPLVECRGAGLLVPLGAPTPAGRVAGVEDRRAEPESPAWREGRGPEVDPARLERPRPVAPSAPAGMAARVGRPPRAAPRARGAPRARAAPRAWAADRARAGMAARVGRSPRAADRAWAGMPARPGRPAREAPAGPLRIARPRNVVATEIVRSH